MRLERKIIMPNFKGKFSALYISSGILILLFLYAFLRDTTSLATLAKVKDLLYENKVEKIVASKEYVYIKTSEKTYKIASSQVTPRMFAHVTVEIDDSTTTMKMFFMFFIFIVIFSLILNIYKKRADFRLAEGSNGFCGSSKESHSESIMAVKSDVSFADIGGISDVKIELEEIIDFLKNPNRYKSFGARLPRGVLLVGPPGVGKTMIAKAVAHAADVPFYYQSGASFVQIYVGMGAKRVHDLFAAAQKSSPAIIFIDEIDAIGKERDGSSNDEREATLNQLLTEMDGFEDSSNVIVVAATNKIEVLDSALLRAGRFDRRVFVDLPTPLERESILEKYLSNIPHSVEIKKVSDMCVGFNGASLAALVNEAALLSLREGDKEITYKHFQEMKDKVLFGKRQVAILSDKQRAYRSLYQSAKALIATHFDLNFEKVVLSSDVINPPVNEPLLKHEILEHMQMHLAGICACELRFGEHASTAASDVKELKIKARELIEEFAMGEHFIGKESDIEVLINTQRAETKELLSTMSAALDKIEVKMSENECVSKLEVKEIINDFL